MEQNSIRTIIKTTCPHCENEIAVSFLFSPPVLTDILTNEDIKLAKATARSEVDDSNLSEKEKESAKQTINDPNIIFGQDAVDEVLEGFLSNQ